MRVNKFLSARRIGAVLVSACFLLTGCGGNNAAENGNANSNPRALIIRGTERFISRPKHLTEARSAFGDMTLSLPPKE